MFNFSFHNPVKIHFGSGQIDQLPIEIPEGQKVLLVYGGGSIKKNGIYEDILKNLDGREIFEFSGIESG